VLARGTDQKVWYRVYRSGSGTWNGWAPLGGMWAPLTIGAPGAADAVVCVRGTDNALWMNVRPYRPYAWQGWQGWHRVGGVLTSAPAAGVFPRAPLTRSVLALGGDGRSLAGPQQSRHEYLGLDTGALAASSHAETGGPRGPGSPWQRGRPVS